jgi:3-deoxy-manno-octulosonate cytidylyltransferase (CMP-KDO synthetase)
MVLAVIPARMGSTRLPGKALADLGGAPMVVRVWERVRRAEGIDRVLVATDDDRIAAAVRARGGEAVMTGVCASGTDRVAEAARNSGALRVVNVQGDEPFVEPTDIARVAAAVSEGTPIATAAAPLVDGWDDPARVKVVCDDAGRALYFSRQPIPSGGPYRLHVGLYAFTAQALAAVAALPPGVLERTERLEQLRWLAAGYRIKVVAIPEGALSVDTPADLERARRRFARAG